MLGKMFRTLRLPANVSRVASERSFATRENAGAVVPVAGKVPATSRGLPLSVTVLIFVAPEDWDVRRDYDRWIPV
jgi:hypothetical protein